MVVDDELGPPPRGIFRLIVDPTFGLFFWGRLLATTGAYVHSIVAAIIAYDATHSALAVALVTVAQFGPQLLFALASGARADQGDVAKQIIAGRLLCTGGTGALMVWLLVAGDTDGWRMVSVVVLASVVVGLGLVTGGAAMQSITPLIVTRAELPPAVTLNSIPMTVGRVLGPASGAFLLEHASAVVALAVAMAGQAVFVVFMLLIRLPKPQGAEGGTPAGNSIRAMLRHVRGDRPLLLLLVAAAGIGFGAEPVATLAPVLSHGLGGGPGLVGALTAAFGGGAAVGIVVSSWIGARLRHEHVVHGGLLSLGAGTLGCGLAPTPTVALVAAAITGAGFIVAISSVTTLIQLRVPPAMLGRVMSLWLMGFVGSRPLAAVICGLLTDLVSAPVACAVVAVCMVAVAAWCRPSRLF